MSTSGTNDQLLNSVAKLRDAGGYARLPACFRIRLTGQDCKNWLNNFCTADVNSLTPGQGCEAFILNVKGKTLAHVYLLLSDFDITLLGIGTPRESIAAHLEKYIIREDVTVLDQSELTLAWYVGGRATTQLNQEFAVNSAPGYLQHGLVKDNVHWIQTSLCMEHDALLVTNLEPQAKMDRGELTEHWLETKDLRRFTEPVFHLGRIAHGTPLNGPEVNPDHLPQELRRDEQTISFTKGCYLGQETVARIDALGHVNQFLVKLRVACQLPPEPGSRLRIDGKPSGKFTSVSPRLEDGSCLALGYVRASLAATGTVFETDAGAAEIWD